VNGGGVKQPASHIGMVEELVEKNDKWSGWAFRSLSNVRVVTQPGDWRWNGEGASIKRGVVKFFPYPQQHMIQCMVVLHRHSSAQTTQMRVRKAWLERQHPRTFPPLAWILPAPIEIHREEGQREWWLL